ncbi:hypothetical protein QL285_040306 [Trifolium repens]|nr:hypothetical protein QL285_040306 [Trifolium repens]
MDGRNGNARRTGNQQKRLRFAQYFLGKEVTQRFGEMHNHDTIKILCKSFSELDWTDDFGEDYNLAMFFDLGEQISSAWGTASAFGGLSLPWFNSNSLLSLLQKCPMLQVLEIQNDKEWSPILQWPPPPSVPNCLVFIGIVALYLHVHLVIIGM